MVDGRDFDMVLVTFYGNFEKKMGLVADNRRWRIKFDREIFVFRSL